MHFRLILLRSHLGKAPLSNNSSGRQYSTFEARMEHCFIHETQDKGDSALA
jgi:hypothetical protein